jgi:hypothetical protein
MAVEVDASLMRISLDPRSQSCWILHDLEKAIDTITYSRRSKSTQAEQIAQHECAAPGKAPLGQVGSTKVRAPLARLANM